MILESLVALIGGLVVRVGTDIATNIENRIINAAIDVANQKQQPQLSALGLSMSDLQKSQNEIKALQISEVKRHYKNGIDFLRYANETTDKEQKKQWLYKAIEYFTSASNVEVGEAAVNAIVLIGACFYALRCIDSTTPIALENDAYDKAFLLAERSKRIPSRELIEQLLRLPYLQKQHGTFEVYWKKYEPPKLVEPPKVIEVLPRVPSLPSRHRKCVSCGKDFYVPFGQFPTPFDCPVCRSKPLETNRGRRSQAHLHLFCQQCWKEFDVPFGQFSPPRYCPECKSKSPWLK